MSKKLTSFLALFLAFAMVVTGVPANVAYAVENEPEIENEIEEEISEDDEEAVEPEESSDEKNDDEEIEEIIVENEPEEAEAEVKLVDAGFYNTWDDTTWDDSYDGIGEFIVNADFDAFEEGTVIEDNRHEYNVEVPLINETFWNSQYSGSDIWGNDFALSFKKDGEDVLIKNGKTVRVTLNLGEAVPKSGVEKIICEDTQGGSIKQCVSNVEYRLYRAQKNTEGKYDISPVEIHKISDGTITFETQTADYFMLRAVSSGDITYRLNHFNGKDRKPEGGYVDQKDIGNYCDGGLNIEINGDNILRQQEWDTNPTAFYVQNGNLNITGSGSLDLDGQRIIANREPEPDEWRYRGTVTIDGDGSDLSLTNVGDVLGTIKVLGEGTRIEAEFSDKPDCGDLYIYDGTVKVTGAGYSEVWEEQTYKHNVFDAVYLFGGDFSLKQTESSLPSNDIPLISCIFMGNSTATVEGNVCVSEVHSLGIFEEVFDENGQKVEGPFNDAVLTLQAKKTAVTHRLNWYGGRTEIYSDGDGLGCDNEWANADIMGGEVFITTRGSGDGCRMPMAIINPDRYYTKADDKDLEKVYCDFRINSDGVGFSGEYLDVDRSDACVSIEAKAGAFVDEQTTGLYCAPGLEMKAGESRFQRRLLDRPRVVSDKYVFIYSGVLVEFFAKNNAWGTKKVGSGYAAIGESMDISEFDVEPPFGYKFNDISGDVVWKTASGNVWNFDEDTVAGDIKLYAEVEPKDISFSLKKNDGSGYETPLGPIKFDEYDYSVIYGEDNRGVSYIPERIGYTFKGWYTAPEGGIRVDENDEFDNPKYSYEAPAADELNQTFYAQWEPNTYKIVLVATDSTSPSSKANIDGEKRKQIDVKLGDKIFDGVNANIHVGNQGYSKKQHWKVYFDESLETTTGATFDENVAFDETKLVEYMPSIDVHNTETPILYLVADWERAYKLDYPEFSIDTVEPVKSGTKVDVTTYLTWEETPGGIDFNFDHRVETTSHKVYYSFDGSTWYECVDGIIVRGNAGDTVNVYAKVCYEDCASLEDVSMADGEQTRVTYKIKDETNDWDGVEDTRDRAKWDNNATHVPMGLWVGYFDDYADYTGKAITFPDLRVYNHKTLLTEGTDYTVKYSNNVKAGTGSFTITGKGNIGGSLTKTFTVGKRALTVDYLVNADDIYVSYTGKAQLAKPVITYKLADDTVVTLKEKTDYTLEYPNTNKKVEGYDAKAFTVANDSDPGTEDVPEYWTINVHGVGNYTGDIEVKEYIRPRLISVAKATIAKQAYTGRAITPDIVLKDGKKTLEEGVDYSIPVDGYSNNIVAGTASVTVNGMGDYSESATYNFTITGYPINKATFNGGIAALLKSGKEWTGSDLSSDIDGLFNLDSEDALLSSLSYKKGKTLVPLKGAKMTKAEFDAAPDRTLAYIYEYADSPIREIGTYSITFTGVNEYIGSVTKTFKVTGIDISKFKTIVEYTTVEYDGTEKEPAVTKVYQPASKKQPETVVDSSNYDVTYENHTNASDKKTKAYIVITGKNAAVGTIKIPFTITPKTFSVKEGKVQKKDESVINVAPISPQTYVKKGAKPSVTITDIARGVNLEEGTDYTLKYANNTAAGNTANPPVVTITGKGNYSGTFNENFVIEKADISNCSIKVGDVVAANKAGICKPAITITDTDGGVLKAKTDYNATVDYFYDEPVQVTYLEKVGKKSVTRYDLRKKGEGYKPTDIIPVGTQMKAVITGAGNYLADTSIEGTFKYVTADLAKTKVTIPNQYYSGEAITLNKSDIKVMNGKVALEPTDYTIVGYSNNINKGKATVTLKGVGNYGGTINATFNIVARPTNFTVIYEKYMPYESSEPAVTGTMKNGSIANGKNIAKLAYKRTGYRFDGWLPDMDTENVVTNGGVLNMGEHVALGSTIHLYPKWTLIEYPITYNLNGGENSESNMPSYNYMMTLDLYEPTRDGYTFGGWYLDSKFTAKKKIEKINMNTTGNIVLYAKWIKN